jgi:C-terminal processing protease CtpA/Prc
MAGDDFFVDDPALLGAIPSPRCTPPPTSNDYDGSATASTRNGTGQTIIDVVAPPGKLGVVLLDPEPPEPPGPAFVCNISTDSPLADKVKSGDKILAVDDCDVGEMSAEDVSKLLGSKITNLSRKITLLREISSDGGIKRESTDAASPATKPADNAVAIRAEIITLCAALQFPRSTNEMLSSYEGREYELLKNLRKMKKMKSNQNTAGGQKNGEVLVNPENSETTVRTGTRIDIVAPPGKLGIVVDSPRDGGLPYVSHIKDYCPIREEIRLGDRLVRINDEDVTKLKGFHISSESLC